MLSAGARATHRIPGLAHVSSSFLLSTENTCTLFFFSVAMSSCRLLIQLLFLPFLLLLPQPQGYASPCSDTLLPCAGKGSQCDAIRTGCQPNWEYLTSPTQRFTFSTQSSLALTFTFHIPLPPPSVKIQAVSKQILN